MTATMGMEVEGVSSGVVKLIDESDSEGTDDTQGQCGEKKPIVNFIGYPGADDKRHPVDQNDKDRGYDEIAEFQIRIIYLITTSSTKPPAASPCPSSSLSFLTRGE